MTNTFRFRSGVISSIKLRLFKEVSVALEHIEHVKPLTCSSAFEISCAEVFKPVNNNAEAVIAYAISFICIFFRMILSGLQNLDLAYIRPVFDVRKRRYKFRLKVLTV